MPWLLNRTPRADGVADNNKVSDISYSTDSNNNRYSNNSNRIPCYDDNCYYNNNKNNNNNYSC